MLARSTGLGAQAIEAADDGARQAILNAERDAIADYLDGRVEVYLDDVACHQELTHAATQERDGLAHAALYLSFECPGSPEGSYRVDYTVFAESEGVVDDHASIVDYDPGGEQGRVVSMFTLAHSVTLALAVLGWVSVPAEIVEPLIAWSIVYVAAENVLGGQSRHRLAVVFGFGLLHGLGFASALRFADELSWGLVASLVGSTLGSR